MNVFYPCHHSDKVGLHSLKEDVVVLMHALILRSTPLFDSKTWQRRFVGMLEIRNNMFLKQTQASGYDFEIRLCDLDERGELTMR